MPGANVLGDAGGGIGSAIGGIAVLAGAGGKGGDQYYRQALEVMKALRDPDFDFRSVPAPQLRIFKQYFPEVYQSVVPEGVKQIVESPELRLTELRNVGRYERMAEEGLPVSERVAEQSASDALARSAGRAQENARADLARRGRLGTAAELASRQVASGEAADVADQLAGGLAERSDAARMAGIRGALEGASGVRGEDFRSAEANANIMNRLAQFIAEQGTAANRYAAAARERAGFANTETRQRVGEENAMNRYNVDVANLERKNRLKSALADFQLGKASALANAYTGYGLVKDQNKAAKEATIQSIGAGVGRAGGGALGFL